MAQPDPYQRWSGAPKHWVEIPEQRVAPPSVLAPVTPAPVTPPAVRSARPPRAAVLAALAITTTVLLTMTASGSSVAELDQPPGSATPTSR